MLPDQSRNCCGWQVLQVSGSISSAWVNVAVPEPEPQAASGPTASVTKLTKMTVRRRRIFMGRKYVLAASACHNPAGEAAARSDRPRAGARAGAAGVPQNGRGLPAAAHL